MALRFHKAKRGIEYRGRFSPRNSLVVFSQIWQKCLTTLNCVKVRFVHQLSYHFMLFQYRISLPYLKSSLFSTRSHVNIVANVVDVANVTTINVRFVPPPTTVAKVDDVANEENKVMTRNINDERWRIIPDFPTYEISDLGNVWNIKFNKPMRTSITSFGHVKISLVDRDTQKRHTRSVAVLVAEAFVEPPNALCDQVVPLDGDPTNLAAQNLVWRPKGFAWKYIHQFKIEQPLHYKNLPICNLATGDRYSSIISCCKIEGLLFRDVWRSTYTGEAIFPSGARYEIFNRFSEKPKGITNRV